MGSQRSVVLQQKSSQCPSSQRKSELVIKKTRCEHNESTFGKIISGQHAVKSVETARQTVIQAPRAMAPATLSRPRTLAGARRAEGSTAKIPAGR
jgi:hypothetical protein